MIIPNQIAKITNQIISKILTYFTESELKTYFTESELKRMNLVCENNEENIDKSRLPPCIFPANKSSNFKYAIRIKSNGKTKCYGYANSLEEAKNLVLKEKNQIYKKKLNQLINPTESK